MQFKFTVAFFLILTLGLLWWSSHQYNKGFQAGRDSAEARCQEHINAQAQALQSALHQARMESRERLQEMEQKLKNERENINRQTQRTLQTNDKYRQYYQTPTPAAVLDSIYGLQ